jgi:carbon monoxide dehydrogenase subunit G
MKIDNEFNVSVPVELAWRALTDLEEVSLCLPGARLTGVENDVYSGEVRVKVGPVVSEYAGTAQFAEKDDANHRAVIDAKGRDSRGAGNASAAITMQLESEADGLRTRVSLDTDLKISGKIAQLGGGMIAEVSQKLLGQFAQCLEAKLAAPVQSETTALEEGGDSPEIEATSGLTEDAATSAKPTPAASPASPASSSSSRATEPPEPLDLMGLAAGSMLKRLVPVVVVVVAVVVVVVLVLVR